MVRFYSPTKPFEPPKNYLSESQLQMQFRGYQTAQGEYQDINEDFVPWSRIEED